MVVLVRERWFGGEREMGLWVLRERKRGKRDLGVGAAMEDGGKKKGDGGKRNGENLDLIVCGKIYGFICKMLTCHFLIEVCKTGFYTSSLLILISFSKIF